jgi:hypothetical protein
LRVQVVEEAIDHAGNEQQAFDAHSVVGTLFISPVSVYQEIGALIASEAAMVHGGLAQEAAFAVPVVTLAGIVWLARPRT